MPIDMNTWQPHGLINDPSLESIYRDAKMSIDENGNETNPKEHATVHLFEDLFNEVIFPEKHFRVNSQVSPASKKGSEKACDLAIKFIDGNFDYRIFCFCEAKRADIYTHAKIRNLEEQALNYCRLYLEAQPDSDFIYACTLVGASIRCWSYNLGTDKLISFWDGPRETFASYRDVGDDANSDLLFTAFKQMKAMPVGGVLPLGMSYEGIGSVGGQ